MVVIQLPEKWSEMRKITLVCLDILINVINSIIQVAEFGHIAKFGRDWSSKLVSIQVSTSQNNQIIQQYNMLQETFFLHTKLTVFQYMIDCPVLVGLAQLAHSHSSPWGKRIAVKEHSLTS